MGTKTIRAAIAAMCVATAFSPAYAEAKEATLKTTYSGSTLTGFQVLVKLSASNDAYGFSYAEAGGSTATNIWFTSADGATVYPHDIDKWDPSGDSFVWVRLPELASGTTFKMHWSDSSGDVQQPASGNVWDGYVGVWHMNETGTAAEPDKTGHGLNAAPINNSSTSTSINTDTNGGQIGNGRAVSQATMFKVYGHASHISEAKTFTISGWVKKTTDGGEYPRVFVGNVDGTRAQWEVYGWTDNKKDTKTYVRGSGNTDWATTGIILNSASGWHYLTVVYNGTTATIYDKGVSKNSAAINAAAQGDFFTIGGWTGKNNRSFVGTFDEVRMYNGALSADRIAADYATMNDPTGFLTLCVAEDWTLTQDETVDGTLFVNSGVTIDLHGYKLTVNGLSGAGTITDSTFGTPGELHYVVPSGETAENTTFAFTGNMKLVVEGGGTFTASKASQSYTGGTEAKANTTLSMGTVTHPFGNGNATQTITLGEGAQLKYNGLQDNSTCCYSYVLHQGSVVDAGSNGTRWIRHFKDITLYGDATFKAQSNVLVGTNTGNVPDLVTLNGHTLYLNLNGDHNMRGFKTVGEGKVVFQAGYAAYYGTSTLPVDLSSATLGFEGSGYFFNGNSGLTANNLYFRSTSNKKWHSQGANESYVLGTYIAGDWRAPFTMSSGATLDLSETSGTWNADGLPIDGNNADRTKAGRITFLDANATYTVDIGTREIAAGDKLVQFTDGYSPASVVFNLAATGAAQTPEERNLGIVVANESGHTYLEVISLTTPYARWVIDNENPENSGWKFYNPTTDEEVSGYSTPTSVMEVRIHSYAEYQAVAQQQGVTPLSYKFYGTIQIPSNVSEWNLDSCFTDMAEGAIIDLNGKRLNVSRMDFTGTITDTSLDTDHPGELHVTVASGAIENTTVTLTGNLKFVKEGSGTFTASKANQTYTGGTEVQAGTLTLGTATHPLGNGNATQTVTLRENAVFNFANCKNDTTCCYNFNLYGGSEVRASSSGTRWIRLVGSATLYGDATFKGGTFDFFGGIQSAHTTLTLNGHTLYLNLNTNDGNLRFIKTLDAGSVVFSAGAASFYGSVDFSTATLGFEGSGWFFNGTSGLTASNLYFRSTSNKKWRSQGANESYVLGTYTAGDWRAPFTMSSGATLDLSETSGTWNADGLPIDGNNADRTKAGLVTFLAANATYTVDIGTRTVAAGDKLVQFADGYSPAASVVFTLAATGAAQTPAEREIDIVCHDNGLFVKSTATPSYVQYDVNVGTWKFFKADGTDITSLWSGGVTSDMEVRINSYAEYQAVAQQQGISPAAYRFYGTIQIPGDVSAWNLDSCFTDMADGAIIDLNGKRLNVSRMNFTGTITDSTPGTPGELHLTVANGTIENTTVTLTGNLKFVKEGSGTLTASKAGQSYTGGTVVRAGTLVLGTSNNPLGAGDATQTVTVGENATFNFNANCGDSTCSYGFILNANSVLRMGTVGSRWNRQVSAITLLGDATYDFGTAKTLALFGGGNAGETVITLNGHTLMIEAPADGDINTLNVRTVGEGTISYRSGMAGGFYPEGNTNPTADFSSANVEVVGNAWMNLGNLAFIAKDFKYTSSTHKWTGQLGTNPPLVTGRYIAGAYRSPFTMASGSTLDLTEVSGTWDNTTDVLDLTSASVDKTTKNGKVSFSGAITVDLTGRTDLQTIARSENPYIVTWDSQPSATFTLDADMSRRYKLKPDANGIKLVRVGGTMLIVY